MTRQRDDEVGASGANSGFEVSTALLGSNIQFRDGSTARLDTRQVAKKLFREARTGMIFDLNEMLSGYYERAKVTPEKLVEADAGAEALAQRAYTSRHTLNSAFPPGTFSFRANEGMKDIERIDFDVEFAVRSRKRA